MLQEVSGTLVDYRFGEENMTLLKRFELGYFPHKIVIIYTHDHDVCGSSHGQQNVSLSFQD